MGSRILPVELTKQGRDKTTVGLDSSGIDMAQLWMVFCLEMTVSRPRSIDLFAGQSEFSIEELGLNLPSPKRAETELRWAAADTVYHHVSRMKFVTAATWKHEGRRPDGPITGCFGRDILTEKKEGKVINWTSWIQKGEQFDGGLRREVSQRGQ